VISFSSSGNGVFKYQSYRTTIESDMQVQRVEDKRLATLLAHSRPTVSKVPATWIVIGIPTMKTRFHAASRICSLLIVEELEQHDHGFCGSNRPVALV
jgi:hypothetical protein